jgi:hypothetical protein
VTKSSAALLTPASFLTSCRLFSESECYSWAPSLHKSDFSTVKPAYIQAKIDVSAREQVPLKKKKVKREAEKVNIPKLSNQNQLKCPFSDICISLAVSSKP